jgi:hypothetical protein
MAALIIFLILMFILYELYFFNVENFNNSKSEYDHYFDGTVFMRDDKTAINIGIGKEPNADYVIDVNGKLTINGDLSVGKATLNYDLAKKINKLPLYSRDKYCLYDSEGNKRCINETQLGMITGHTKVMFKNRYGEVLTNLKLKHHGNHDGSDPGRKKTGSNPWNEGIQYRDFEVDGKKNEDYMWNQGFRNGDEHHSLENNSNSIPNDDNQFKLIPIETIDNRLSGDESNVRKILLYHPGSTALLKPHNGLLVEKNQKEVGDTILNLPDSVSEEVKLQTKSNIDSHHGAEYIRLEKIPNSTDFYIRVKKNNNWGYLRVLNDNSEIRGINALDDYPSGTNRFTITNTDTGNTIDFNSIKQTVTIKGSNGLYLCLGRKKSRFLYGRFALRFLNVGKEYDWKFVLYIEQEIKSGDGENDDFVERKEYVCNQ